METLDARVARLEEIVSNQTHLLGEIAKDVKSLLDSRSYMRGVVRTVIYTATLVSTGISLFIAWLKH